MLDIKYINYLNNYLLQCYHTTVFSHELPFVHENRNDGIDPHDCAEIIYTLRSCTTHANQKGKNSYNQHRNYLTNQHERTNMGKPTKEVNMEKKLKHKLLEAVILGKVGTQTNMGVIITTKEFVNYFCKTKTAVYLRSYLSSVTIESGRHEMLHNKYLFRLKRGVFRIHQDAITHYQHNHFDNVTHEFCVISN